MNWHRLDKTEIFELLGTGEKGLNVLAADEKLLQVGPNELAEGKKKSVFGILLAQFKDVMILILLAARIVFHVPLEGSLLLLLATAMLFIIANLAVGITFSTLACNQLQAVQMAFFFFLPSMLLSGFMFPFRGMPVWAQAIGEVLPLTHFLRIVRGILLKGNGVAEIGSDVWPIALFALVAVVISVKRYRRTLD